jgi:hypothetical protein
MKQERDTLCRYSNAETRKKEKYSATTVMLKQEGK